MSFNPHPTSTATSNSLGLEVHWPLPGPELAAIKLQKYNHNEHDSHNRALDPVFLLRPRGQCPIYLHIPHDEATPGTSSVKPCRNLSRAFWIGIKTVRVQT